MGFRAETVALLKEALVAFDADKAEKVLRGSRARVASDLSKRTAEALVARLGPQGTLAEATLGPPPKLGAGGAMKNGLPFVGVAGGVVAWPLLDLIGLGLGTGTAIALGVWNARKRIPVIGQAPVRPTLPYQVADAPDRFAIVLDKLPEGPGRGDLLTVGEAGFRIMAALADEESLVSVGAGGVAGGMGQAALGLVNEAIRVAELIVRETTESQNQSRLETLEKLAKTAREALGELEKLDQAAGASEDTIKRETELVRRTLDELKKLV